MDNIILFALKSMLLLFQNNAHFVETGSI